MSATKTISIMERSFLELVKDQPGVDFNRTALVAAIKNIRAQSFSGKNIFEHPLVDNTRQIKYVELGFQNPMGREEHYGTFGNSPYEEWYDMFSFDLVAPKWSLGGRARVVIWTEPFTDFTGVAVQFFVEVTQRWTTIHCKTSQVMEIITGLFPQE